MNIIGQKRYFYQEIDSTNNEAKRLIKKNVPGGTIVVAAGQSGGRGQFKRTWFSPSHKGIYLSVILYFPSKQPLPPQVSLLGSLASARAVKILTGLEAKLKKPNDLTVNGKKVGGVLTEVLSAGQDKKAVIVGIGLNVNTEEFPEEIRTSASSLKLELGREVDQEKLLELIIKSMDGKIFYMLRGIRGAITVKNNNADEIKSATRKLLEEMAKVNSLKAEDLASIVFSVTRDLNAAFPAEAAREIGWKFVPLLCVCEIAVPASLTKCIRVLMHVNTDKTQKEIKHVYLEEAKKLREDF